MWSVLEKDLNNYFPITNVTWKSPISSSQITIDKLPLRCLPSTANLFKDTDHPFRWFLAPYVSVHIIVCESLDNYKTCKQKLKLWVDSYSAKRASWLLLYLPMGSQSVESYQKIYARISSDFYQDRAGDRSCLLFLQGFQGRGTPSSSGLASTVSFTSTNTSTGSNSAVMNSFPDLIKKIRDGVVASFQQR
jgi:hypothetical protein